jgi:hypothetical protein
MPYDLPGPVETQEFRIDEIWREVQRFLREDVRWQSVPQDTKDEWFVKTDDSITVSCDSTEQDVTKCEILPSTIEERPYPYGVKATYKFKKNAHIQFSKRAGIAADHEFTDALSMCNLLRTMLLPRPRPAAKEPERRSIKKMYPWDKCEEEEEVLDFMVYYDIHFFINANNDIVCPLVRKKGGSYEVHVEPKIEIRGKIIPAHVITYENQPFIEEYEFNTVESLISALGRVGVQVNTDVDDFREVSRLKKLRSVLQRIDTYLDRITLC